MPGEHLPTPEDIGRWPSFSAENPLRILLSACLAGVGCGVDGTSYGAPFAHLRWLFERREVRTVTFCPEDFAFGTPRAVPDIHGGNGFDVLDGTAKVLSEDGEDWTREMIAASKAMLEVAEHNEVRLAVLMDMSAACGSQVIYLGARESGLYQAGQGVAAALLVRSGIQVVSQRDRLSLERIRAAVDPSFEVDPRTQDHHQTDWYLEHLTGP
jgi:uncharacterized protein YbbK (DUF523 family)